MVSHLPRLRSYAASLTSSSAEAEDLVQETMLRAWRKQQLFQPGSNMQAWLCAILKNIAMNRFRAERRTWADSDGQALEMLAAPPGQEHRWRFAEAVRALDELKPEAREALMLVALGGLTYEEAAQISGCGLNTMKTRIRRARGALAARLGESVAEEGPARRASAEEGRPAIRAAFAG